MDQESFGNLWESDLCYSRRTMPSGYTTTDSTTESSSAKRKGYQTIQCEEQGRRKITTGMRILEASNRRNNLRTLNKDSEKIKPRLSPLSSSTDQGASVRSESGRLIAAPPISNDASPTAISPFEIPFVHRDASVFQWHNFYELLKNGKVVRLEWEWFVHSEPRKISIFGWALRAAMIPGGYFTINIIDAILRVYLSRDNGMYLLNPKRWRHFIAASWTDAVLHGSYGAEMLYQSKYFVGPHILYELRHCRMFPAPVNLDGSWSCYFWDFLNKEIIVLDPQMQLCKGKDIHKRHGGVVKLLHKALFLVINRLFPEWDISSEKWKRVYRNDVSPRCQWGESGLYSVHYAYTFNGLDLTESLDMGYHNNRRAKLIWMLLAMWGNSGIVPPEFGQLMYPSA